MVAGQGAQTTGKNRQAFRQAELGREIGNQRNFGLLPWLL